MSAAFASRSSQRNQIHINEGPDVGQYDPHARTTMAAQASGRRQSVGGFGTSARNLDWGKKGFASGNNNDNCGEPTSAETATVKSTFDTKSSARHRGPSSAMGGGSRFAPTKQASGGDHYVPPALGASKSVNGNRRASLLGTMGSARRFNEVKVGCGAKDADYSDAAASRGAFAAASKKGGPGANTGFGGNASRVTMAEEMARKAQENASSHLSYDNAHASTGAFASKSQNSTGVSAAFASKSSQRNKIHINEGPAANAYNTAAVNSIASAKSFNKSHQMGTGGFGTSARRTTGVVSARGHESGSLGPGEYAPDLEETTQRAQSARPSSAFASTTRKSDFHVRKANAAHADYDAHKADGMAAQVTKTFNRKSSFGSMGTSKRFAPTKEAIQADYNIEAAKPGAFSKSQNGIGRQNAGFGGTAKRETYADELVRKGEETSHLSYDAYASTGAFAKASEATGGNSAAFASKSSQRNKIHINEGPAANAYNTAAVNSIASAKSFNKSHQMGTGGFGTSARRTTGPISAKGHESGSLGPGEYAPDLVDISDGANDKPQKPSSAFASTTRKDVVHRATASADADYDAHADDGMAATATKSFNKKVGGGFGAGPKRQIHQPKDTPGPGEYQHADPSRPTVDTEAKASKGRPSGAFASTTLRDTTPGGISFSSFLP